MENKESASVFNVVGDLGDLKSYPMDPASETSGNPNVMHETEALPIEPVNSENGSSYQTGLFDSETVFPDFISMTCGVGMGIDDETDGVLSDIKSVMSRARSESEASLDYYCTDDSQMQVPAGEELPTRNRLNNDRHIQQSRRLPYWLWYAIAKCLGIKLHDQDRPIFATVLYSITFMSAVGYVLSNWWFSAYDIVSDYTKTTVIDGTISVLFSILWASFGIYANKLAYRLFSHKKFLNMLRLHSKTILKMNAAAVLFALMLLFTVVNNIGAFSNYKDETCITVSVEVIVCKLRYIMRVVYSAFAVIWNYLVAFVVISVCRTHVIGIRKFMQALEQDARIYEARFMGLTQQSNAEIPVLEEYTWLDEDYYAQLQAPGVSDLSSNASALFFQQTDRRDRNNSSSTQGSVGMPSAHAVSMPTPSDSASVSSELRDLKDRKSEKTAALLTGSHDGGVEASSSHSVTGARDGRPRSVPLMSNSEILFRYWKIQSRLRMSSVALQRWMISVISLVIIWLAMNLVLWLTYDPTLTDLANFFLPLGVLPLLSSAYAEVNQEGLRLLKFICLVEDRLQMIFVLQNSPLQMTVYGFTLSYSTITTAAFGVLLAFASKVLIQEISVPPKA